MKWNWGTGIVLSFALFCGFVIYVVVRSYGLNVDLVSDNYYTEELTYQTKIDKKRNLKVSGKEVQIVCQDKQVKLSFPAFFKEVNGKVDFYHPSRQLFDKSFNIKLDSTGTQYFSTQGLILGRYKVRVDWTSNGQSFYQESEVFIK